MFGENKFPVSFGVFCLCISTHFIVFLAFVPDLYYTSKFWQNRTAIRLDSV